MDLGKLNAINSMENSHSKSKKRLRKSKRNYSHNQSLSITPKNGKKTTKYSNIRLSLTVANRLKSMQNITGDSSRSALLSRMLKIVNPVILNNTYKKRKYKHDLRLIVKKERLIAELDKKM